MEWINQILLFFVEPISHFTYFRVTVQTNLLLYEPGRFSKIEPEIQGLHGSFMIHKSTKKQYNYSKIIDWYYFFFVEPISHLANFQGQCPNRLISLWPLANKSNWFLFWCRLSEMKPTGEGLHGSFMIHKSTKKQYNYSKCIDWYYFFCRSNQSPGKFPGSVSKQPKLD